MLSDSVINPRRHHGSNVNKAESRNDLLELRDLIREFVSERDWDQFHTPKNLATALSVEASELLEPFQWLVSGEKSELDEAKQTAIRHEMADVLGYLIRLADKMDVDLFQAVVEKMALNRKKYPADKVRGDSRKYSEYED
jgi:NTP pyrophosphatase (non-canonical NTP hydrolase)